MALQAISSSLPTYRYVAPASWALKRKTWVFFFPFSTPLLFLFFEVKSVAQAISKLDIAGDGCKLLILLPLSRPEISSVHYYTWFQSCSLKSLWILRPPEMVCLPVVIFQGTWLPQQSTNDQGQEGECRLQWNDKKFPTGFRTDFKDIKAFCKKKNLSLLDFTG